MSLKLDNDALRQSVRARLSEKRFRHTLGVEELAVKLGEAVLPECIDELRAAALLHDIAKEKSREELLSLIGDGISGEDLATPPIYHALAAPRLILRDFPEYATENVLSGVLNHTTGNDGMSLFDIIIFISDFCEAGREYQSCIDTREALLSYLSAANDKESRILAIYKAAYDVACATVEALVRLGRGVNQRTLMAKKYFKSKISPI